MKHHLLAIGISRHQNSSHNLSYAAKDASEFSDLLRNNIGNIGFERLLIDSEATLAQIRTALGSELQKVVQPEDAFFFFYSGHGVTAEDPDDESQALHYLIPFDATFDYINTCIPVSYLKQVLEKIHCKAKFVFIDSCFSGSVSKYSKGFPMAKKKAFKNIRTFTNTEIGFGSLTFTACKDDEEAIEDPDYKNGLFSYFLFEELQKDKGKDKFAVVDIFTPISQQVTTRAKEKYNHSQNPTLLTQLEENIYLPTFRRKIKITPQMIEVPRYAELSSTAFPVPELKLEDKEQEKIINEMIDLVLKGGHPQHLATQEIVFERFCHRLVKKLNEDWETIFSENGGNLSEIPHSVSKLEGASVQFFILGAVITTFGSEEQMGIYAQHVVDIFEMTRNRAGFVALIAVPEIIIAEIIYLVGIICLSRNNVKPLQILLKTKVYDLDERDKPPMPLLFYNEIHFCEALGGNADKVNNHVREILKGFTWLSDLAPRLGGKTDIYQIQVNLLLKMLSRHKELLFWSDFARFSSQLVWPLVQRIKYDLEFRKQIAELFEEKESGIRKLFAKYVGEAKEGRLGGYFWHSIDGVDFLIEEERETVEKK